MRVKELISTLKDSIEIIKTIAIVGLFISSFFGAKSCLKIKEQYQQAESILTQKEKVFVNKLGQKASEVKVMAHNYKQLEESFRVADAEKTEYQKQLSQAKKDVDVYKERERNLRSYNSYQVRASDTVFLQMPAQCDSIPPIKTEHIKINFIYNPESNLNAVFYDYFARVNTLVLLTPKRKENGKKHFPNWGFLPWVGWDEKSITTIDDKNAKIENQISVEFRK